MAKNIGIGILLFIAALSAYYYTHPLTSKVKINSTIFAVEVAATEAQKELGLGGRSSLTEQSGMLFPYDHKEQYEYWMRGMKFPLDFIWIDGNTIADITENVPVPLPNEQPVIVKPQVAVDKVLEVRAGSVKKNNISIGDTVTFLDR